MDISTYNGVLVFAEQRRGLLQKVAFELLGEGRRLADRLGEPLVALVAGAGLSAVERAAAERAGAGCAQELIAHGADLVLVADDPALASYRSEAYTRVLVQAISEIRPGIVLVGATSIGRDLAPRVSARLHTGLTADCTSLAIDDASRNLLMTRPAFGGNIMATIVCPEHRPQMSTVRPGVMRKLDRDPARRGETRPLAVELSGADARIEILEEVVEKAEKKNIEDAVVLVSGGRGMGSPENFRKLDGLAHDLGGLVSASRAVVDAGWVPQDRQVGQTGKTVRPDLYIACGISGMIQHIAGMEDSGFIVAVNKNRDAPIFEYADLGIVTDVNKLIPALREELQVGGAGG